MQQHLFVPALCFGLLLGLNAHAEMPDIPNEVQNALSEEDTISRPAVQKLRTEGKPAFERLVRLRDQLKERSAQECRVDLKKLNLVIDQVGGARYSSVSGLYWHTDLDQAMKEAMTIGKPVLSLRMMGKLTDEYSCANSRFFRTTLYANTQISLYLKKNFVLHWKSVRPVPKVTIDFGDGRKLERTLTGNSIHYVICRQGYVLDGLPGLYGSARFLKWVKEMQTLDDAIGQNKTTQTEYLLALQSWHVERASRITRIWKQELDQIAQTKVEQIKQKVFAGQPGIQPNPPALAAAQRAIPKSLVEVPILVNILRDTRTLEAQTPGAAWEQLAKRYLPDAKLDQASIELIRTENPILPQKTPSTAIEDEQQLQRIVTAFEKSIAIDMVRNEYLLRSKLHGWLSKEPIFVRDLEKLNERVYTELFLTPRQDPWIGLVPPDTYTGLVNGGVSSQK